MLGLSHMDAQMEIGGKTLFGNEWIDYSKEYLKIVVRKNAIYKLSYEDLRNAGFPASWQGSQLKLYNNGEEQALYTSTEASWGEGDYLLFYGEKNDGEIDKFHYRDWRSEQLNPKYSMYTDDRVYFLCLKDPQEVKLRYTETDNGLSGPLPELQEFYIHHEELVFSDFNWSPSTPDVPDAFYSSFIKTEGFGTAILSDHDIMLMAANVYNGGPASQLEFRTGSNTQSSHIINIEFNGDQLDTDQYSANQVRDYSYSIPTDALKSNNSLRLSAQGFSDLITVAHASISYPRELDALNSTVFNFGISAGQQSKLYEVKRFTAESTSLLMDIANMRYLEAELTEESARFVLDNPLSIESDLYLVDVDTGVESPASIALVSFNNIDQLNPEFLILTSDKINNNSGGANPIDDYMAFRSSDEGGEYETAALNVENIYDQFGYGIKNHSLAIRNFSQYVKTRWPDFKMVFLVGKALSYGNRNRTTNIESLVPTYGKPGSDILMFADPGVTYPYVGVGRLAARNKTDVSNYLEKVRLHAQISNVSGKSIEERMWLKQIIHLSGGDPSIQQQLFNHLTDMKDIMENSRFGARVNTYRKTSSDPVTSALSQKILDQINSGIAMLSFFGHSSASTFDFSVEDPDDYENTGRLPIILSMGCRAGDIHETAFSLSEDMILTEGRGAIAFVASSGSAFPTPLAVMGKDFYSKLGDAFYEMPVGMALRQVAEDLFDPFSTKVRTLYEQTLMHGDPAILMFQAQDPDYVVDISTITTGGDVGATDDKISLSFDIVNLGRGVQDSINNLLIHEYGDGQKDSTYFKTPAPFHTYSASIEIDNPGFEALGKNTIDIILDVDKEIQESPEPEAELNNSLKFAWANEGFSFFVFDNSAFPVYPNEYSIVSAQGVSLVASSTNAFAEETNFVFELDTSANFDSPILMRSEMSSSPAYVEWQPNIQLENNTVYYWRVSPGNVSDAIWNGSSFVYIDSEQPGWNQSHIGQWNNNSFETFGVDSTNRQFRFAENVNEIIIKNGSYPLHEIEMTVQNDPAGYLPFLADGELPSGVYVSTFDDVTGLPWINKPSPAGGLYGSELYTWWAQNFPNFPYKTDTPENRGKAINFIDNIIPDGNYVVLYTIQRNDFPGIGNYMPEEWAGDATVNPDGKDLMTVLEGYGAQRVRELATGARPYIFVFKKNDPGFPVYEIVANDATELIELNIEILGSWFEGNMTSEVLGPASSWNRLSWRQTGFEQGQDEVSITIIGIQQDGTETLLYEGLTAIELDLSPISAVSYPRLRMIYNVSDTEARTSPQLQYWRVYYDELSELVIDIPSRYVFKSDTLYLGETFEFGSRVTNISNTDIDSLLVKFSIVDASNNEKEVFVRTAPISAGGSQDINFQYPTDELLGVNQFRAEINASIEQGENYFFNNTGVRNFTVLGDRINPLLDISFDGMRIMDGDIVSPSPHIRIVLKDENEFLLLDDIDNFELSLKKLPDNSTTDIDLSSEEVVFTPADSMGVNEAVLEYFPELEEGEYVLYVQATDASGNLSGDQNLEVRFRVIEDTRVSNVLNYPNPFSTSTQFVFTLTGYELPDIFTIQIMTVSGKVVREITKEELGDLRIGLNRTSYRWDGTDEYGTRLANGVYLYRVITSFEENTAKHFDNSAVDPFFREGFGKLVIMR